MPVWYDLTLPIAPGMPGYPGDPTVQKRLVTDYAANGYRLTQWQFSSHTGTHIDAPSHFINGGSDVDAIPLSVLIGSAQVVDVRHRGAGQEITVDDIVSVLPCSRLLLCTGWDTHHGTPSYFGNMPGLSAAVVDRLIAADVRLLGIDAPNIHASQWAALHHKLLGAGVLLLEGLRELHIMAGRKVQLVVAPLPLLGSDGAPARVYAAVSE